MDGSGCSTQALLASTSLSQPRRAAMKRLTSTSMALTMQYFTNAWSIHASSEPPARLADGGHLTGMRKEGRRDPVQSVSHVDKGSGECAAAVPDRPTEHCFCSQRPRAHLRRTWRSTVGQIQSDSRSQSERQVASPRQKVRASPASRPEGRKPEAGSRRAYSASRNAYRPGARQPLGPAMPGRDTKW